LVHKTRSIIISIPLISDERFRRYEDGRTDGWNDTTDTPATVCSSAPQILFSGSTKILEEIQFREWGKHIPQDIPEMGYKIAKLTMCLTSPK
jgi:hypothetical protein